MITLNIIEDMILKTYKQQSKDPYKAVADVKKTAGKSFVGVAKEQIYFDGFKVTIGATVDIIDDLINRLYAPSREVYSLKIALSGLAKSYETAVKEKFKEKFSVCAPLIEPEVIFVYGMNMAWELMLEAIKEFKKEILNHGDKSARDSEP